MNPEAAADTAVLVSAVLMLVAIGSKLITANLVTRSKGGYARLDVRRKEAGASLKEMQLKTTSTKGTLEFWERRRTETTHRVQDAARDLDNYIAQYEEAQEDGEGDTEAAGRDDVGPVEEEAAEATTGVADPHEAESSEVPADEVAGENESGDGAAQETSLPPKS